MLRRAAAPTLRRLARYYPAVALTGPRDSSGNEVDVIVERKGRLYPLEVKSGKTVAGDYLAGLERFARIARAASATLVYAGDAAQKRSTATILGWREIDAAAKRVLG